MTRESARDGKSRLVTERGCPRCGHNLANHYEDADVRWCANCDGPCDPQRGDGGGSESAPGLLADEERSAPPPPAEDAEYDEVWQEAHAVARAADYLDVPMGDVVRAVRSANDAYTPLPESLDLSGIGNLASPHASWFARLRNVSGRTYGREGEA